MDDIAGVFLDVTSWSRRAQFELFRGYEQPFFDICAEVDVTEARRWCKAHGRSFSLASWFICQRAINAIESFRYRLRGERVWVHERVRIATTAPGPEDTFRFCYLPYAEGFAEFERVSRWVIDHPDDAPMDGRPEDDALIHGSMLPWLRFKSIAHARRLGQGDSTPKIVFGKATEDRGRVMMPVSIAVHHALMDGVHACRFFTSIEDEFARPNSILIG